VGRNSDHSHPFNGLISSLAVFKQALPASTVLVSHKAWCLRSYPLGRLNYSIRLLP
jgi:hypothetical protein